MPGTKRRRPWPESTTPGAKGGAPLHIEHKKSIINMYYNEDMEVDDIYPLIPSPRKGGLPHVKKETVEKVIKYFDSFGTLEPAPRKKRARKMAPQHVAVLVEIVKKDPYLFLEEIATELTERTAVEYAVGRCYYELRSRGYCLKKMRKKARQRNERKRDLYWETIAELLGHTGSRRQLFFADETAKDTRALRRWRGWGLGGDRVEIEEMLFKGKVLSILALYGCDGFIDFDFKVGGYKGDDFFESAMGMIIPHLGNYARGEDNSILVLDNCQIHKTRLEEFQALVEAQGAKLVFLAPYCPIDNPIEKGFNVFKQYWRRNYLFLENTEGVLGAGAAIVFPLKHCYSDPKAAALGTYESCGYSY